MVINHDLDHREVEEQTSKGDDMTQNEKETKKNHLKKKRRNEKLSRQKREFLWINPLLSSHVKAK